MPNLVDTAWLLAEAGYWHEASAAAYTCRDLYTDERVLLGGAARLVANEKLGRTKLHHACLVGNLSRVQALLDCGLPSRIHSADRNAMTMDYRALDGTYHSSVTPLELAISGGHAFDRGDVGAICLHCKHGAALHSFTVEVQTARAAR